MEETKNVWIQFSLMQSTDGLLKVTITANRTIKSVIADDLLQDKEQLEDYMILVMNKAIVKASKVKQSLM
jgi:DNA-binding protein YbaB